MSHVVLTRRAEDRQSERNVSISATPEYAKFRSAMEAVAAFVTPSDVLPMLDEFFHEQIQTGLAQLAARPTQISMHLGRRGESIISELLGRNRDHVAGEFYVCKTFGLPRSTLRREKNADRVIAYRLNTSADFFFPLEQFENGGVYSWAGDIVDAVGNGAPAIHFLYVPRQQLNGFSFGTALRDGQRPDVVEVMRMTLNRLTRGE